MTIRFWRCKNTSLMLQKKSNLGWISKLAQSQKQETYRTTSLPYYPNCKTSERFWLQCVLYRCCHHCDFYDRYCCFCCRIFYCKFNTFLWKKDQKTERLLPSVQIKECWIQFLFLRPSTNTKMFSNFQKFIKNSLGLFCIIQMERILAMTFSRDLY